MENVTKKRKSPVVFVVLAIVVVLAFFGIRALLHNMKYEHTDNAQVEARSTPIISRVAGYIDSLGIDDFGAVASGQHLLTIDDIEYKLAVVQAQADLMNARADMANANAALSNSLANKKLATSNSAVQHTRLTKAKSDLDRDEGLFKEGAITQKQLDDTRSNFDIANRQYVASEDQVNLATTQVAIAQAQLQKISALIETRKASLDQAQLRLSYCLVSAPAKGRIGKLNLEKGQYVQPGQPLFTVVNDDKFWIVANFKETQIAKMKEGQEVDVKLDGYPDVSIRGKITSFSLATGAKFSLLPPDNATGNFVKVTQRVPVKIELVEEDKYKNILKAGLSADVEVKVK